MSAGAGQALGVGLAIVSAMSYAAVSIFIRKGARPGLTDHGLLITLAVNIVLLVPAVMVVGFDLVGPAPSAGVAWFALSGVLATVLGRIALFGGISRIGPSRAGSLKNAAPVVAVVAGITVLGDHLSLVSVLGILLGLAGVAVLVFEQTRPAPALVLDSSVKRAGMLLGAAAAVFFGSAQVTRQLAMDRLPDALLGTLLASGASVFAYLALLIVRGRLLAVIRSSARHVNAHLIAAGVTSAGGMLAFNSALLYLPVSQASVIAGAEVLFTLLFAAVVLRRTELVNRNVAGAALLVFSGAVLIAAS